MAIIEIRGKYIDLEWVRSRSHRIERLAAPLLDYYKADWRNRDWHIDCGSATGPELIGPSGLSIRIDCPFIQVFHLVGLADFGRYEGFRMSLRSVCRFLAAHSGCNEAIYTHELVPFEGENLKEVQACLENILGPSASSFEELAASESFGKRAWLVDDFADMPREV